MSTAGALAAKLALDSSGFRAEMAAAGTVADKELKKIGRQVQFVNDYIREMAKAQKVAGDSAHSLEQSSKVMDQLGLNTTIAKRELIVLAHEMSQGNYTKFGGSMMVLAEHSNIMAVAFSAAGIAVLGGVAALGAFAVAAMAGSHEAEEFRKSLILTGNAAGLTSSSFEALAENAATAAHSTLGQGKDALQALVSTGRVGQQAIEEATKATLLMEKVTGQSSDEVAKDFAKMSDGVAKWAEEHNKQYHYLTAAQFLHIKQLEDEEKVGEAMAENFKALSGQMKEVTSNLGYLARAWNWVGEEASAAWNWMKGLGKQDTTAEQIADVRKRIEEMQARGPLNDLTRGSYEKGLERLKQELYLLQEKARLEQKSVDRQAKQAAEEEKKIKKIMHPDKALKGDPEMGPLTFDQMWPAANVREILKYQEDNMDARRAFFMQEKKDAEEIARQYEAYQKPRENAIDVAISKWIADLPDNTKRAEALVKGAFGRMEDAIVNFAKTGKLSFSDLWGFMAEEFIREQIHMAEKSLLTNSAGSFIGVGGILSSIGSFLGISHANGLDRVPYDGYPAILHKGERVQTALQANAGGGSGGMVIRVGDGQVINIGQGVSRAEVMSAINQANLQTQLQIRRQMRQGVLS